MKAAATVYKGIEFVTVQELPAEQQFLLTSAITIERINILVNGKIVTNCIQYKDYQAWYAASFEQPTSAKVSKEETVFTPELSLKGV